MGAHLCSLNTPTLESLPNINVSNDRQISPRTSIMDLFTPDCMKPKKRQLVLQEKKAKTMKITLEDCLLSSPSTKDELHMLRQASGGSKIHPHLISGIGNGGEYFCLEKVVKVDEEKKQGLSRCKSGKMKKRVSFRLPEEADIFIFYEPKEDYEQ